MKMKKRSLGILTAFVLLLSFAVTAFAADVDYDETLGWTVEYDGSKLNAGSDNGTLNDALSGMQPGDSALFTVDLKNSAAGVTDWWMSNEAIQSFEDNGTASGGAYTYTLTYYNPSGAESVLYTNASVGGESPNSNGDIGLHEATGALKNHFMLDTLSNGQTAKVTLLVALDGVSQGNNYQKALSEINLNFAVEEHAAGGSRTVIKTGDATNTLPFFIAAVAAGIAVIVLIVVRVRKSSKEKKGGARA